ncbi:MAG: GNAT family N-acetyltransferase [Actinobacteria bacterium]|nr:GNAT family N-acetyltransferase [Actinomycetota bacterium]
MSDDLVHAMTNNWFAWLDFTSEHAAGASETFGTIRCSSVGAPMGLFNQAFVFEEPETDDLVAAARWLSERDVPFWVTSPASLAPAVAAMVEPLGLVPGPGTLPGMAITPLTDLPVDGDGVEPILRVTDAARMADIGVVAGEAFGAPSEIVGDLAPASMLDDDRNAWFLQYVDGEPAACGQLLRTDHVAGVYTIGVREQFRRRGLGAAITAAVLAEGRDQGCSIGILQASPMGEPVYDRMGFDTVTQYHRFEPRP